MVLTSYCCTRYTHHWRKFNDIPSCAFVIKHLRSYNGHFISAYNHLMCWRRNDRVFSMKMASGDTETRRARTRMWFGIHNVVRKCWLINGDTGHDARYVRYHDITALWYEVFMFRPYWSFAFLPKFVLLIFLYLKMLLNASFRFQRQVD